jgi:hypothetical protein
VGEGRRLDEQIEAGASVQRLAQLVSALLRANTKAGGDLLSLKTDAKPKAGVLQASDWAPAYLSSAVLSWPYVSRSSSARSAVEL